MTPTRPPSAEALSELKFRQFDITISSLVSLSDAVRNDVLRNLPRAFVRAVQLESETGVTLGTFGPIREAGAEQGGKALVRIHEHNEFDFAWIQFPDRLMLRKAGDRFALLERMLPMLPRLVDPATWPDVPPEFGDFLENTSRFSMEMELQIDCEAGRSPSSRDNISVLGELLGLRSGPGLPGYLVAGRDRNKKGWDFQGVRLADALRFDVTLASALPPGTLSGPRVSKRQPSAPQVEWTFWMTLEAPGNDRNRYLFPRLAVKTREEQLLSAEQVQTVLNKEAWLGAFNLMRDSVLLGGLLRILGGKRLTSGT